MKRTTVISFCIILVLIFGFKSITVFSQPNNYPTKVSVLFYDEGDYYNNALKNNFIQIRNSMNINTQIDFYDGKLNQEIQNSQLDEVLEEGTDVILISIVDFSKSADIVDKVKVHNIPLIFFIREPQSYDAIRSYGKSIFISTDNCQLGITQSNMIINQMENNSIIDRNHNGNLDYILLKGNKENEETEFRNRCAIEELNKNRVNVNEVYSEYMNWDKEIVKERLIPLLTRIINNIDVIISNSDEMAIGAIESLQQYGYNLGNNNRYIPVVGMDGIPPARELINQGIMEGTVLQDPRIMAEAIYKTGVNLYNEKHPLEGTDYTFDSTGVSVRIPNGGYIVRP